MARIWFELQKNVYSLGEEVSGTAHVSLDKPISQRGAVLYLVGKERTEISYQKQVQTGQTRQTRTETAVQESEFLHQEYPISLPVDEHGKGRFGDHTFPFRFTLQQGRPTSYRGPHARIQYMIGGKIDVPMGLDVRESMEFNVVPSTSQPYQSAPTNAYSGSWGNMQSAGISFTIDKAEYGKGEAINGRCLFRNPSLKELRKIDIALRWVEMAAAQNQRTTTEVMRQISQVPMGGRVPQGEAPFSINVPPQAPTTYEASLSNVRCGLTASIDIAMGLDIAASQNIRIVEASGYGRQPSPQYPGGQVDMARAIPPQTYQPTPYPQPSVPANRCAHCGALIAKAGAQYCPTCGSRL